MALPVLVAGAREAGAADWNSSLSAGLSAGWNSNPALTARDMPDDRLAALTLSADATARTERDTFSVTPRFTATRYEVDRSLDTDTGSLDLSYARRFERSRSQVSLQALVDSTLTSELGQSGITDVNRRHESLAAAASQEWSLGESLSWSASGSWQAHRYIDAASTGLNNYRHAGVSTGPMWSLSETTQAGLVLGAERTMPNTGNDQNAWSASVRIGGRWSERSAWNVQGGATRVDAGTGMSTGALVEASASSGSERLRWSASLRHDVSPVGYGFLARKNRLQLSVAGEPGERDSVSIFAAYSRSGALKFARFTVFDASQYVQAGIEWRRRLFERVELAGSLSHVRARSGRLAGWADSTQARLGLVWLGSGQ